MSWNDLCGHWECLLMMSSEFQISFVVVLILLFYDQFKDGAHYCYCAHFLRMPKQSRATRKKYATRRTRGLVLSPVSLGGSSYFLWKRCVVFQQMKNNFYLPCQFFENRRSMRMLLFLPYGRSEQTFQSQTKVNSKTSKVIASRCYTWSLGIKQSLNRQGLVKQKENSSKSSA